ncbi:MAG TPA: AEC family transporter [Haliscomenobacter sp.]|uniref:AEC family transporter n=1 Tax=Haliscomenobacter sp. TaxID=2717303 RepID=UPI002BC9FBEB|nr:AEC family transporter [Haliscomenobacter sp.]HOY18630.1 AEC family transporter [Haliscomenobacter sp.]
MTQANHVFIITLSIIAIGFLLKKYGFVTEKDGKTISKFLMHTTFPALMIVSTARVKLDPELFLIPLFCIGFCGIMLSLAWFWFSNYSTDLRGVLTMGAGTANVGLFGFPIIEGLFGKEALVYAVMFDIGNTIIAFGVVYPIGRYFASGGQAGLDWKPILKRVFSLPPFLGLIIGLSINIFSLPLPTLAFDALDVLAKGNKPLVLLLMGVYLSFALDKNQLKAISKVLFIRYSVGLTMVAVLYFFLPADSLMRSVLIMCVLLPLGMTILPFSDEMNFDSRIAGTLLNISLLISFVLMWVMVLGLGLM